MCLCECVCVCVCVCVLECMRTHYLIHLLCDRVPHMPAGRMCVCVYVCVSSITHPHVHPCLHTLSNLLHTGPHTPHLLVQPCLESNPLSVPCDVYSLHCTLALSPSLWHTVQFWAVADKRWAMWKKHADLRYPHCERGSKMPVIKVLRPKIAWHQIQKFRLTISQCDCFYNLRLSTNQLECGLKWCTDQHDTGTKPNSVGLIILQSTYIKLNVVPTFIRSILHSVACNKLILILLKSHRL